VICHGIPDTRPLEDGDIVNIDVSTYIGGCHGDLNEVRKRFCWRMIAVEKKGSVYYFYNYNNLCFNC